MTEIVLEAFRLNGRLLAAGDRLVEPLGLSSARWQVLGAIHFAEAPQPVAWLARSMGLSRQGVQRIANELEKEGLVAFEPNPHHRRANLVVLTEQGREVYQAAERRQIEWVNALSRDFTVDDIQCALKVMAAMREDLAGSVLFIFQPAEEGAPEGEEGGAELMLKEGLFKRYQPEAVFGMHIGLNMAGGKIAVRSGPAMAAVDEFRIKVQGKQTHGARPWGGIDPIVVGSQIILGLQTIASRQLQITKVPYIITVGQFTAGIRNNIIPDEAHMWGTIRSFDKGMQNEIHERIEQTASGIAASAGTTADVSIRRQYPVTYNDPGLTEKMMPTLERITNNSVVTPDLVTGAEDFSFFADEVPGLFLFLGAAPPDANAKELPGNHSPLFTIHEPNMEVGVRAMSHLVWDYLEMAE